ncbi:MAG: response regulator [Bacteroidia bacterium]
MNNFNRKRASILVVEDNHVDIMVLKVLLEKYFNLYIVTNGEDAIKATNEFDFDIILTDINLGHSVMDGVKVMKAIRENKKNEHLKIYAVTGYTENREYYIETGFNEVLTKPVIKEEIFDILNETIPEHYKFSTGFIRRTNYN